MVSVECLPDTYLSGVTCLPCPALSSTLGLSSATAQSQCHCTPDQTRSACYVCPFPPWKYHCPGDRTCLEDPILKNGGWWTIAGERFSRSTIFFKCPSLAWCTASECSSQRVTCHQGHSVDFDLGRLCSKCVVGYRRDSSVNYTCRECPHAPLLFLIISMIISLCIYGVILWIFVPPIEHTLSLKLIGETKRSKIIPKLQITIFYFVGLLTISGLTVDYYMVQLDASDGLYPLLNILRFLFNVGLNSAFLFNATYVECTSFTGQTLPQLVLAVFVPILYFSVITGTFLLTFARFSRHTPHEIENIPFVRGLKSWRSFLAFRSTCRYIWALTLIAIMALPCLTRRYSLHLPCMPLYPYGDVVVYSPDISCGDDLDVKAKTLSILMLALLSFGLPLGVMFLCLVAIRYSWLTEPRWQLVMGIFNDGYSLKMSRFPIFPLRYFIWMLMTFLSIEKSGGLGAPYIKIIFSLLFVLFWLLFHIKNFPYEQVYIQVESFQVEKNSGSYNQVWRFLAFCKQLLRPTVPHPNLLNQLDSLGLWSNFLTYAFILIAIGAKHELTTGIVIFCIAVINSYTIFTLLRHLFSDFFHNGIWYCLTTSADDAKLCCLRFWSRKKWHTVKHNEYREGFIPRPDILSHKFRLYSALEMILGNADEEVQHTRFVLTKAARISPFPAEALSQIHRLLDCRRLGDLILLEVTTILLESGHVEPQPATLTMIVPFLKAKFLDVSEHIYTRDEFSAYMTAALDWVAERLKITPLVRRATYKADQIALRYSLIRQVIKPKETHESGKEWTKILNVKAGKDIRNRFLAVSKFFVTQEDINRAKANFKFVFPGANPVLVNPTEEFKPSKKK